MDLNFTIEQQTFAETVRKLFARQSGPWERTVVDGDDASAADRDRWLELASLGVLGITVPDSDGGLGLGMREVSAVMIEAGRALARQPYVEAALIPAHLIAALAPPQQRGKLLDDLLSGDAVYALAHLEPHGTWDSRIETTARDRAGQVVLHGTKTSVLAGDRADRLLVTATAERGDVGAYLVHAEDTGVRRHSYRGHDGSGGAIVELDSAIGVRLGSGDAAEAVREAVVIGQLALCAEAVGALERCLELTVEHLRSRTQFGTTLGSFQALAHRAADLYVAVQTARALTLYATSGHAEGKPDEVLAARAKLQVGRSARLVGQEVIQMHGAIGMTAEHPVGHYVTRLLAIEHTFGSAEDQLSLLAARVKEYDHVEL